MAWVSIALELDLAQAETLSEALMEAGAESVALDPAGSQMLLTALAAPSADAAALVAAAASAVAFTLPAFTVSQLADEDWVRRSQAQFGPIRVSDRLWIVPSWHTPPDPAAIAVRLDPGLAFGTGSHVSTRQVLGFLERHVRKADRVLDYGCGSGILAIVAAKLGAGEIAAVDIDPQALETTQSNASGNGVSLHVAAPESLGPGTYDLVIANILAGPLVSLEPLLAARARQGGRIALSGILESQAAEVADAYSRDFEIAIGAIEEGWALVEGTRR
ncbi:MAG TPA: 50S ribosomal protein L11 methyltransferase [Burkholderiales bacterium]|nr:50S ribosomal protein L11 methyltransferase [Burkholderiales bacterium]